MTDVELIADVLDHEVEVRKVIRYSICDYLDASESPEMLRAILRTARLLPSLVNGWYRPSRFKNYGCRCSPTR